MIDMIMATTGNSTLIFIGWIPFVSKHLTLFTLDQFEDLTT